MFNNPFLGGFAPSIEETGIRPGGPNLEAIEAALFERDRQDAVRQMISDRYRGAHDAAVGKLINIGGQVAGRAARPVLRPLAQGARNAISNLLSYSKSSPVTSGASPAASGGNTLLSAASRAPSALESKAAIDALTMTPEAIETAGQSAATGAGEAGTSLLGSLGTVLGTGAAAYGAYEGIRGGVDANKDLNEAIDSGISREEEDDLRQQHTNAGMVEAGTGAAAGALAGTAVAPGIGTAIGAVLGAAGGVLKSSGGSDSIQEGAKRRLKFMSKPWKH